MVNLIAVTTLLLTSALRHVAYVIVPSLMTASDT